MYNLTLTFIRELITMAPAFTMGLWGLSEKTKTVYKNIKGAEKVIP